MGIHEWIVQRDWSAETYNHLAEILDFTFTKSKEISENISSDLVSKYIL